MFCSISYIDLHLISGIFLEIIYFKETSKSSFKNLIILYLNYAILILHFYLNYFTSVVT